MLVRYLIVLLIAPAFALGDRHSIEMQRLVLDESRVDVLGWTDAHHVAYGSQVVNYDGQKYAAPTGRDASSFLEAATDEYLCVRNDFGQTALHLAVRQENMEVLKLYIDRRLPCLNTGNKDGDTPLHYASYWGRTECARLLLKGGADPQQRNKKGQTPLDDAREARSEGIALMFAKYLEEKPHYLDSNDL